MESSQKTSSLPTAQVSSLFDQWASTDRAQRMATGHQPLMTALLAELAGETNKSALLDLGCGTGSFLAQAAASGFSRTCGIDASPKMVETAQNTAPEAELQVGNFAHLPWPAASFDNVTTMEAIYYCPEPLAALKEVARVLKTGGRFDLVIDYYQDSSGTSSWPEGLGFEITSLSATQWVDLLAQAGLEKISNRRIIRPQQEADPASWKPSVWFPTEDSYLAYLEDGALWLTGYLPSSVPNQ
ncbi:class I SAM-dependent methyltransferase [Acaryochloris thomasi]|nr:class I SAM-dependent methyltransferase [Acaryochloris thomasi]